MNLFKIVALPSLLLLSSSAFAVQPVAPVLKTTDLGTFANISYFQTASSSATAGRSFINEYDFTLASPVASVKFDFSGGSFPFSSISNLTSYLYKGSSLITSSSTGGITASLLDPGTYAFKVGGLSTGHVSFGAAFNVAAVPEPEEWALMLSGMGLLAWRLRNVKRTESVSALSWA